MNEVLMSCFTAVITVATVAYVVITIKLWKATKSSADVAKASVVINYLTVLAQEGQKLEASDLKGAALLRQVAMLLGEVAVEQFLEDIDLRKQPRVRDAMNTLFGLFRAQGIDPENIPFFRPVVAKMKLDR